MADKAEVSTGSAVKIALWVVALSFAIPIFLIGLAHVINPDLRADGTVYSRIFNRQQERLIIHAPNTAPRTATPCTRVVNGAPMTGKCW